MKKTPILCGLLLIGCAQADHAAVTRDDPFSQAVSICAAIANPQKYEGKNILINGLYRWEPHGAVLLGRSCTKEIVRLHSTQEYKEEEHAKSTLGSLIKRDPGKPVNVVYRGVFRVNREIVCSEVNCFRYQIDVSELIAVRPAQE